MNSYKNLQYYTNLKENSGKNLWDSKDFTFYNRDPISSTIPINWELDPYNYRSWMLRLSGFEWMDLLIADFKFSGNTNSIIKAVSFFKDWDEFYLNYKGRNSFEWHDHAVSLRTHRLIVVIKIYQEIENYNLEVYELLLGLLDKHFKFLISEKEFKKNNHGIFQTQALAAIIYLFLGRYNSVSASEIIYSRLEFLWKLQFGKELMHKENSPMYHKRILKYFEDVASSEEFKKTTLPYTQKDLLTADINYNFLFHPSGDMALLGDTNLISTKGRTRWQGAKDFKEAGYLIFSKLDVEEKDSYLIVRSGFPDRTHRHEDDFSFEYSEQGQLIFSDSGRFSYNYDDPMRIYLTSSAAHNTIDIDGTNFPWWGDFSQEDLYNDAVVKYEVRKDGYGCFLSKEFESVGVVFSRELDRARAEDGSIQFSVIDQITTREESSIAQWFHFPPEFSIFDKSEDHITLTNGQLYVSANMADFIIRSYRGSDEPLVGWISYKEGSVEDRVSVSFSSETENKHLRIETKWIISNERPK